MDDDALDSSYDSTESPNGAVHDVCVFYWKILIHISLAASDDVGKDDQDADIQDYDGPF